MILAPACLAKILMSNWSAIFLNDKQHGQGTFTWISGAQYVGGWKEHSRQGQGVYIEADGEISTGIWVNRTCIKTLSFQSLQKTRHWAFHTNNQQTSVKFHKLLIVVDGVEGSRFGY